jgi:peptidoglycan/LPS O-acetylase OafA/YrhL
MYGSGKANFGGAFSWPAIVYALWEPLVAWGLIAAWLLVFRARMNSASAFWTWLNRRAYAVYIIHPPVLVGITLLLHHWIAPAMLKFLSCGCPAFAGWCSFGGNADHQPVIGRSPIGTCHTTVSNLLNI